MSLSRKSTEATVSASIPPVRRHVDSSAHRHLVTKSCRRDRIADLQFVCSDLLNASIRDSQHRVVGCHANRTSALGLDLDEMVLTQVFRDGSHRLCRLVSVFVDRRNLDVAIEFVDECSEVVGLGIIQSLLNEFLDGLAVPPCVVSILNLRLRVEAVAPLGGVKKYG